MVMPMLVPKSRAITWRYFGQIYMCMALKVKRHSRSLNNGRHASLRPPRYTPMGWELTVVRGHRIFRWTTRFQKVVFRPANRFLGYLLHFRPHTKVGGLLSWGIRLSVRLSVIAFLYGLELLNARDLVIDSNELFWHVDVPIGSEFHPDSPLEVCQICPK